MRSNNPLPAGLYNSERKDKVQSGSTAAMFIPRIGSLSCLVDALFFCGWLSLSLSSLFFKRLDTASLFSSCSRLLVAADGSAHRKWIFPSKPHSRFPKQTTSHPLILLLLLLLIPSLPANQHSTQKDCHLLLKERSRGVAHISRSTSPPSPSSIRIARYELLYTTIEKKNKIYKVCCFLFFSLVIGFREAARHVCSS